MSTTRRAVIAAADGDTVGGMIVFRDDNKVDFREGFRRGECFIGGALADLHFAAVAEIKESTT